jgi:hypothetical protein
MPSPGVCSCVTLIKTDVSVEVTAYKIRIKRISELGSVSYNIVPNSQITYHDNGVDMPQRYISYYKSHTASHSRGLHSPI